MIKMELYYEMDNGDFFCCERNDDEKSYEEVFVTGESLNPRVTNYVMLGVEK